MCILEVFILVVTYKCIFSLGGVCGLATDSLSIGVKKDLFLMGFINSDPSV